MGAPDAGVYVEVIAPDLRFVFLLSLLLVGIIFYRRRWKAMPSTWHILALLSAQFALWLYTSGNGRYFIPGLLLVGVASMSLLHRWPATRSLKLTLAIGMCALQGYAVYLAEPFVGSSYAPWREAPAFPLEISEALKAEPATYVTLSTNTYSILAPRLHSESRWVNLANLQNGLEQDFEGREIKKILSSSKKIIVVMVGVREMLTNYNRLSEEFTMTMNERLRPLHLKFDDQACDYLRFNNSSRMNVLNDQSDRAEGVIVPGFWFCRITYIEKLPDESAISVFPAEIDRVMKVMDRECHRFFDKNLGLKYRIPEAIMVFYADADMRLFVEKSGRVSYKYFRSISPIYLGQIDEILASQFKFDCQNIRGRSGLPWERLY
jgi:hypothetical protein